MEEERKSQRDPIITPKPPSGPGQPIDFEADRLGLRETIADLNNDIAILQAALRGAILDRARTVRRTIEVDPAGNTYTIDWLPRVRAWAKLCDLDLDQFIPHDDMSSGR